MVGMLAARGVLVHARNTRFGKDQCQVLLDFLRSEAQHAQPAAAALGASRWRFVLAPAVVAAEAVAALMVGEAHIALLAFGCPITDLALPQRHISAPVLEQDHLLALRQCTGDLIQQCLREMPAHLLALARIRQIHGFDRGHRCVAETRE